MRARAYPGPPMHVCLYTAHPQWEQGDVCGLLDTGLLERHQILPSRTPYDPTADASIKPSTVAVTVAFID